MTIRISQRGRARAAVAVVLAAVTAVTLVGCASSGSSAGADKTLTIAAPTKPGSLDPTKTSNGATQNYYQELAYAPVLDKDAKGDLIAGLATKWGWAPGFEGTRFDLTIRSGVKFADGEAVTADAVAKSLAFFSQNASGPTAASYAGWKVTATGADTVQIVTATPSPILPDLLTPYNIGGNIISPKGLADPSALATKTFGAGPYVYDPAQSVAGDHYVYTPNKNYYDRSKIHFDKVVIKVISNQNSALQALKSGQVDLLDGDATLVSSAKAAKLTVTSAVSGFGAMFLVDWRGTLVPALGQLKVRQALNYALDRKAIAQAVFGAFGSPTEQPNTPGWDAYDPALQSRYSYDPAKAKQLLADAGYPQGFTFNVVYTAFEPQTTKMVQAEAAQLAKIGVTMNLTGASDFTALNADLASLKYSGFAMLWGGQTQFANTNQLWQANSTSNFFRNTIDGLDPAFTAYLNSSLATRDATAQSVEKVIVDQGITTPVAQFQSIWLSAPPLKGFQLDVTGNPTNVENLSK